MKFRQCVYITRNMKPLHIHEEDYIDMIKKDMAFKMSKELLFCSEFFKKEPDVNAYLEEYVFEAEVLPVGKLEALMIENQQLKQKLLKLLCKEEEEEKKVKCKKYLKFRKRLQK